MDRLGAGIVIAVAVLAMNGSLVRDVLAAEAAPAGFGSALSSAAPAASGPGSARVLSLVLTLEALRAAPAPAHRTKV